ncbi:MAG: B12-binding domain-containing radical SAM protein [Phycisphaerae bacterium]|nr:B12-binding domain-containing radical SAM protein [Phycisphaerae bacterium]
MRKIALIDPATRQGLAHREQLDGLRRFRYCPHLGLQALAAASADRDVRIIDERLEPLAPETLDADVVGITVRTALAPRAHELAQTFHRRGIRVVFGGPYVTLTPELALADPAVTCAVRGPAVAIWNQLLTDLEHGAPQTLYEGRPDDDVAVRCSNGSTRRYRPSTALVQITQGCNFRCRFCVIPALYQEQYTVPAVEKACETIAAQKARVLAFVDDNLIGNLSFARQLCAGLRGAGKKWVCQATLNVARDPSLLALMAEAGCVGVNIGIETLNTTTWEKENKQQNFSCELVSAIRRMHEHGICVSGGFIFGFDQDDIGVFDRALEFMARSGIDFAACHILTPYPGLPFHDQLRREGRILTGDLSRYSTYEVVFRPRRMTPDQLQAGFDRVVREFYSIRGICRRFGRSAQHLGVSTALVSAFGGYVVHSNLNRGLPIHA